MCRSVRTLRACQAVEGFRLVESEPADDESKQDLWSSTRETNKAMLDITALMLPMCPRAHHRNLRPHYKVSASICTEGKYERFETVMRCTTESFSLFSKKVESLPHLPPHLLVRW